MALASNLIDEIEELKSLLDIEEMKSVLEKRKRDYEDDAFEYVNRAASRIQECENLIGIANSVLHRFKRARHEEEEEKEKDQEQEEEQEEEPLTTTMDLILSFLDRELFNENNRENGTNGAKNGTNGTNGETGENGGENAEEAVEDVEVEDVEEEEREKNEKNENECESDEEKNEKNENEENENENENESSEENENENESEYESEIIVFTTSESESENEEDENEEEEEEEEELIDGLVPVTVDETRNSPPRIIIIDKDNSDCKCKSLIPKIHMINYVNKEITHRSVHEYFKLQGKDALVCDSCDTRFIPCIDTINESMSLLPNSGGKGHLNCPMCFEGCLFFP